MALKKEEIEHLADLARLQIDDEEIEQYGEQMTSILEYVQTLGQLDTDDVEEFAHATSGENAFRADEVKRCENDVREKAIGEFPNREGDLLEVQAVFEDRTE
jgi:aspartyl-tRNA(Asn)/glutamyl-tRNA(Gln) amidotransferase subunit C